jgi:hypothetical protein
VKAGSLYNLQRYLLFDMTVLFYIIFIYQFLLSVSELYQPINLPIVIHLPFDNSQPAVVVPFDDQEFEDNDEVMIDTLQQ